MWGNPFSPYAEFSRVLGNELEEIPEQIAQLNLGDAELGWLPTEMHGTTGGFRTHVQDCLLGGQQIGCV